MLIFSGLGSLIAGRVSGRPKLASAIGLVVVLAWIAAMWAGVEGFMMSTLDQPVVVRAMWVLLAAAPAAATDTPLRAAAWR